MVWSSDPASRKDRSRGWEPGKELQHGLRDALGVLDR